MNKWRKVYCQLEHNSAKLQPPVEQRFRPSLVSFYHTRTDLHCLAVCKLCGSSPSLSAKKHQHDYTKLLKSTPNHNIITALTMRTGEIGRIYYHSAMTDMTVSSTTYSSTLHCTLPQIQMQTVNQSKAGGSAESSTKSFHKERRNTGGQSV